MDWTGDLDEGEKAKRHKSWILLRKKNNFHDLQETGWILSYTRLVDIELYKTGGQQACTGNLLHDTIPQQWQVINSRYQSVLLNVEKNNY